MIHNQSRPLCIVRETTVWSFRGTRRRRRGLFRFEEWQSTFVLDVDKPALASPAERSSQPAARTLRLPANLTAAAVNPENGDVAF